jgi:hypothetical protein
MTVMTVMGPWEHDSYDSYGYSCCSGSCSSSWGGGFVSVRYGGWWVCKCALYEWYKLLLDASNTCNGGVIQVAVLNL